MWEPQPLATVRASTASAGISLPFYSVVRRNIVVVNIKQDLTLYDSGPDLRVSYVVRNREFLTTAK
jgi:hypothetical protein